MDKIFQPHPQKVRLKVFVVVGALIPEIQISGVYLIFNYSFNFVVGTRPSGTQPAWAFACL